MLKVQNVTAADKTAIMASLKSAGFTARVKMFPNSLRLVTAGDVAKVASIINEMGYCLFGKTFTVSMFQDINPAHIEVHIHHKF